METGVSTGLMVVKLPAYKGGSKDCAPGHCYLPRPNTMAGIVFRIMITSSHNDQWSI